MEIGKNLNFAIHFVICVYMIKTISIVYLDIILKYTGMVSDGKKLKMKDRESILGHVYHYENPKGEKYVRDGLLPVFLKNGHGQGYQD